MKITQEGLDLIKSFEGLRLQAYQDAVGVWTIGYGHTRGVAQGMRITEAEAEEFLRKDVEDFERGVAARVRPPLNPNEFSALVSFAFNVGLANLARSTALRLLNKERRLEAAEALTWWNKAGGRVLPGLVRRRHAEKALFLKAPPGYSFDPKRTGTEDDSRATPSENAPVRKNLAQSRTLQGAAIAALGGGGAATTGLVRDEEDVMTETPAAAEATIKTPAPDQDPAPGPPQTETPAKDDPLIQDYVDDPYDWTILAFAALLAIGVIVIALARIDDWMNKKR